MKTIYDLKTGETWYYHNGVGRIFSKTLSTNVVISDFFLRCLEHGNAFLTEEDCQKSIDYDVALAKITKRASELEQEVELLEDYQYIDLHESKHRGLTIHPTHYIDCAKLEKYAREKIPYKLCFDYNVCVSLIEELPEECKVVLGVE